MKESYDSSKSAYVAIKVHGITPWLWFDRSKTTFDGIEFVGKAGWGEGGCNTDTTVSFNNITGLINSEALQYDN